jgi:hypothetical protein
MLASCPLFSRVSIADHSLLFQGATIVFLSSQVTFIFKFFLSRNLHIARERAWQQTVASRGKGPTFWQPYVEEWDVPPKVNVDQWAGLAEVKNKVFRFAIKRSELAYSVSPFLVVFDNILTLSVALILLHVVPVGGLLVAAAFKALDTARYLHKPVRAFTVSPPFL